MSDQVNFEELVKAVKQSQIGQDGLSIWGGRCAEDDLLEFLKGWNLLQMSYRIWEYVSDIVFEKDTLPNKAVLLQRGRLFGEGGDLEVRRDGAEFAWRFVGKPNIHPPEGHDVEENDFWKQHPDATFLRYEETALLWGKRNDGRWHDERVAAARLDYPDLEDAERAQVEYTVYSRAGRVQFIWYTGLNEWKEGKNDG